MPTPNISPAKAKREALFFRDRLMRMRKSSDVWPWIEVKRKQWPETNSGDPNLTDTINLQEPRGIFVSELVMQNRPFGLTAANILQFTIPRTEVQLARGAVGVTDYSSPMLERQVLGSVLDEIKRFRTGQNIPPNDLRKVFVRSEPSTLGAASKANGFEHSLWLGWRGYQRFMKGSNPFPQYTYAEFADRGYLAEPFVALVNLYPPSVSANEVQNEYVLTDDFAVDYITVAHNGTASAGSTGTENLFIKLEAPGRPIMQDFVPVPFIGTELARTAWLWDQPLWAPKNERWTIRLKSNLKANYAAGSFAIEPNFRISVALHGHKLIKQ